MRGKITLCLLSSFRRGCILFIGQYRWFARWGTVFWLKATLDSVRFERECSADNLGLNDDHSIDWFLRNHRLKWWDQRILVWLQSIHQRRFTISFLIWFFCWVGRVVPAVIISCGPCLLKEFSWYKLWLYYSVRVL